LIITKFHLSLQPPISCDILCSNVDFSLILEQIRRKRHEASYFLLRVISSIMTITIPPTPMRRSVVVSVGVQVVPVLLFVVFDGVVVAGNPKEV
jgi:hypothetical protein